MNELQSLSTADQLVESLKEANKSIRMRFIYISVLTMVSIPMLLFRTDPHRLENKELSQTIHFLQEVRDSHDLEQFLSENDKLNTDRIRWIDGGSLLYKLKEMNYKDRGPIIDKLEQLRKEYWDESKRKDLFDQSFNIGGLSIPIVSWFYFVPFIILVFFHDTTHLMAYRRTLVEQFKKAGIVEWRQGADLPGLAAHPSKNFISRVTNLIGRCIAFVLLLTPLICTMVFVKLTSFYTSNWWLLLSQLLCAIVIFVDLFVLFIRGTNKSE